MLKRSREIARTFAESAGIIAPDIPRASKSAEEHRQGLVAAQHALESAEQALQAAHDRGAEDPEVTRFEAALAAAKAEVSRAESRYLGAEKRLAAARDADAEKLKAAARVKLADSLAIRAKAAENIDRLAGEIADWVQTIDAQDSVLAEAVRDGVAPRESGSVAARGQRAAELALSKAGAIPRAYAGDPTQHPDAVDVVGRDNEALSRELPKQPGIAALAQVNA
ncbi:MAG: hypothetical protein ACT4P9_12530 [Betaproteobacteria bacterium]